jgi:hypothetical protein
VLSEDYRRRPAAAYRGGAEGGFGEKEKRDRFDFVGHPFLFFGLSKGLFSRLKKLCSLVNYLHKYYVDPKNKTPHPVVRIENAYLLPLFMIS